MSNRAGRSTFRRYMLQPGIGALAQSLNYLWVAKFGTAQAAPMPASYPVDTGVLEKVLDGSNIVSVANDKLDFAGTAAVNFTNPAYVGKTTGGAGFARAVGRIFAFEFEVKTNTSRPVFIGLSNNVAPSSVTNMGIYLASGASAAVATPTSLPAIFTWTIGTYNFRVLEFSNGFALFGKGGAVGSSWKLLWVDRTTNSGTLYPAFQGVAQGDYEVDRAVLVDGLGGVFGGDYTLNTIRDVSVASGDTFVGTADGIHSLELTIVTPAANDDLAILEFRVQDSNNKQQLILKRNAGNTNNDLQVRTVTGGTPATPSGWSDVTTINAVDEICVIDDGTSLYFYTRLGTAWTKRGATLTNSSFQTEPGLRVQSVAGVTLNAVNSYPRTLPAFAGLDLI